jgi:hypothetical protein
MNSGEQVDAAVGLRLARDREIVWPPFMLCVLCISAANGNFTALGMCRCTTGRSWRRAAATAASSEVFFPPFGFITYTPWELLPRCLSTIND